MKTVVITGASSGIGYATAKHFVKKGYLVYNLDKNELLDKNVKTIYCDVTKEQEIQDAINKIEDIDILVNCAGIFGCYYVEDTPDDFIDEIVDVNLKGYFLVTKIALPKIRKSKGNIVFVSSGIGINPDPTCPLYCMTKASINSLVKSLALSEINYGVRVNAVLPGPIKTPLLIRWFKNNEELDEYQKLNPQNMIGDADDVANAILFLSDEKNKYVNGSFLTVDGGESISSYLPSKIVYRKEEK